MNALPPKPAPGGPPSVTRYAEAMVPTIHGDVRLVVYRERGSEEPHPVEHVAMVFGDPAKAADEVLVRVHSECITSEVFGSLKCDCRDQLLEGIIRIQEAGHGIICYLRQEGRGIGLGNKIRAYALQNQGLDTIEANLHLGFDVDLRRYDVAADMLKDLGVRSVRVLTNNPEKLSGLAEAGILVAGRESIEIEPNRHSESYLVTKQKLMGHLLALAS